MAMSMQLNSDLTPEELEIIECQAAVLASSKALAALLKPLKDQSQTLSEAKKHDTRVGLFGWVSCIQDICQKIETYEDCEPKKGEHSEVPRYYRAALQAPPVSSISGPRGSTYKEVTPWDCEAIAKERRQCQSPIAGTAVGRVEDVIPWDA